MRRRHLLVLPATLSIGLVSCTVSPEPDWEAAQAQADAYLEVAGTSENFLGGGTLHALQQDAVLMVDEGITLDYPSEARIDGISVACFGGGEASFGTTVRAGSAWTGLDYTALVCDGEPRTVPLDQPLERINSIRLNGQIQDGDGAVIAAAVTGAAE